MKHKVYIGKPKCGTNVVSIRYFVIKIKDQPEQKFILNEKDAVETVIGSDGKSRRYYVLDIFINDKRVYIVSLDNLEYFYIGREVL